ncbi:MAG: hypothetical protein NT028_14870 [candidate division Zixibacteria bacterium]|nr:hypothetical protein [candidate division Zixibacteria bacterium]
MERYPNTGFADQASERIDSLRFMEIVKLEELYWYEEFLKRHPDSRYADRARAAADSLRVQAVKNAYRIDVYENFLRCYPNGKFSDEARENLRNLKAQIETVELAARKVLPEGADVVVNFRPHLPEPPELEVSAPLVEGSSADDESPYVRGDYGTKEKLTWLVKYRSAQILKSIASESKLPDVSRIVIQIRHGVRESVFSVPIVGVDRATTIYEVSIPLDRLKAQNWSSIDLKSVMELWNEEVNLIPELDINWILK